MERGNDSSSSKYDKVMYSLVFMILLTTQGYSLRRKCVLGVHAPYTVLQHKCSSSFKNCIVQCVKILTCGGYVSVTRSMQCRIMVS